MIDELLKKFGVKYEDLSKSELETLNTWMQSLKQGQINLQKVQEYIKSMREAVENELSVSEVGAKQDIFLKARLRNYLLLEGFLVSPEKAKERLEKAIMGLAGVKK